MSFIEGLAIPFYGPRDTEAREGRFRVFRNFRASVLVALVERILELNRRLKGAMERGAIEVRWQHGWAESRRGTIPCPP